MIAGVMTSNVNYLTWAKKRPVKKQGKVPTAIGEGLAVTRGGVGVAEGNQERTDRRDPAGLGSIQQLGVCVIVADQGPGGIGNEGEQVGGIPGLIGQDFIGVIDNGDLGLETRRPEQLAGSLHGRVIFQVQGIIAGRLADQEVMRMHTLGTTGLAGGLGNLM